MVEFSDLATINRLYFELQQISVAVTNLDGGGTIVSMSISAPQANGDAPPGVPVFITTSYMTYPPQMLAAIKQQFTERRSAIEAELNKLGVTGDINTALAAFPEMPPGPVMAPMPIAPPPNVTNPPGPVPEPPPPLVAPAVQRAPPAAVTTPPVRMPRVTPRGGR